MGKPATGFWVLVKRYAPVVIFPTIAISTIYADLRHTRLWKKSLEEKAQQASLTA